MTAQKTSPVLAPRRRPGRPVVGPMINVRMPDDLVAWLDERRGTVTRARHVRELLEAARRAEKKP